MFSKSKPFITQTSNTIMIYLGLNWRISSFVSILNSLLKIRISPNLWLFHFSLRHTIRYILCLDWWYMFVDLSEHPYIFGWSYSKCCATLDILCIIKFRKIYSNNTALAATSGAERTKRRQEKIMIIQVIVRLKRQKKCQIWHFFYPTYKYASFRCI